MRATAIFIFFLWSALASQAQIITDWQIQTENFQSRVKSIEFFIDRFNNQPEGSGKVIFDKSDSVKRIKFSEERNGRLFSLFDWRSINRKDTALQHKLSDFIKQINNPLSPQFIQFNERGWLAQIDFEITQNGKKAILTCYLQTSEKENVYTWALRSFTSDILHNEIFQDTALHFNPSAHGTDFMEVRLKLQQLTKLNESRFTDVSSELIRQLSNRKVVIQQIAKITYHFLQIEGWMFSVEYFNRASPDSGWLIKHLTRLQPKQKEEYLNLRKVN